MNLRIPTYIVLMLVLFTGKQFAQGEDQMNILFIAVDDLKPVLGCYGDTLVFSPHIDAIASEGLTFTRNYCQQAVCAPSRVSLMTSRYPDQTRVWDLETQMREMDPGIVSLPQYLRQYGYRTAATGKIFDPRSVDESYDAPSWSIPWGRPWDSRYYSPETGKPSYFYASQEAKDTIVLLETEARQLGLDPKTYVRERYFPAFESADVPVDAYVDGAIANVGIELMDQLAASGDPFFLGIGFHRPHLPFNAPTQFWDLYKREDFSLASFRQQATGSPSLAYHNWDELRSYTGIPETGSMAIDTQLELIHGYYAAVSYIDHLIGLVVNRLDELGLKDNTIIVIWGDHGWHLGDHRLWCKHSNFEQATRSPLIISYPLQPNAGASSPVLTEFTDIAPTLCELTGLDIPEYFEGESLKGVFADTLSGVREAALSQYPRNGKMGYTLRSERYRYTRWVNPTSQSFFADELYDYQLDPLETKDISADPDYTSVRNYMDSLVRERITIPSTQERILYHLWGKSNLGDSSNISGARIELGQSSRYTDHNGELLFTHHTGDIAYQINAMGYSSLSGVFPLRRDTLISIQLSEEYYDLDLTIQASWNGQAIPSALVHFAGTTYVADTAGKLRIADLLYDSYSVSAAIPGETAQDFTPLEIYSDTSIVLSVDQPTYSVSIQVANYYNGRGIFDSEVYLGGLENRTDYLGFTSFSVTGDSHPLSIINETYENLYDTLLIRNDTSFSFSLRPTHSMVKFWLKEGNAPVTDASVVLDGDTVITNFIGVSQFETVPASHTYTYSMFKEGYRDKGGELLLISDTTVHLQMERATGISSRKQTSALKLRPNPAGDVIFLLSDRLNRGGQIRIIDIYGRTLYQDNLQAREMEIRIDFLDPGIYWICHTGDSGVQMNKFLKQ